MTLCIVSAAAFGMTPLFIMATVLALGVTLCVDVEAAALALGVGKSAIRRWIESGDLPCVKFPSERHAGETSRRVLLAVADLEKFVERHRTGVAK